MTTVSLKGVTLGEGPTKVIVPLTGSTRGEILAQAHDLAGHELDIVEWRVDFFDEVTDTAAVLETAAALVEVLDGTPVLFTFRTSNEGGEKAITPADYADLAIAVIGSGLVDAVDVELFLDAAQGDRIVEAAHGAGVVVVMSNHDFGATPAKEELVSRLGAMVERGADVPKIAVMPRNPGDVLTLLGATYEFTSTSTDRPVITMSMAGTGVVSRLAGEVFGSAATFGMVGRASAPGQVPVAELAPVLALIHANV